VDLAVNLIATVEDQFGYEKGHRGTRDELEPLARRPEILCLIQLASWLLHAQDLRTQFIQCLRGIMMLNAPYLDSYPFSCLARNP
jgi:hypothetical protein